MQSLSNPQKSVPLKRLLLIHATYYLTPFLPGSSVLLVSYNKWTCSWMWNRSTLRNCMAFMVTKLLSPGLQLDQLSSVAQNQESEYPCIQMPREGGDFSTEHNR